MLPIMPSTKIVWIALDLKSLNDISWTTDPNSNKLTELFLVIPSTKISQMVPLNGSAQMDKRIARALDKKCILTTSPPEPLVYIQNNFTEFFLMMPSTKLHKRFHSAEQTGISLRFGVAGRNCQETG